jgi:hypothetical protein
MFEGQQGNLSWNAYIANFARYKKYKQTGDIKDLDPKIKVV